MRRRFLASFIALLMCATSGSASASPEPGAMEATEVYLQRELAFCSGLRQVAIRYSPRAEPCKGLMLSPMSWSEFYRETGELQLLKSYEDFESTSSWLGWGGLGAIASGTTVGLLGMQQESPALSVTGVVIAAVGAVTAAYAVVRPYGHNALRLEETTRAYNQNLRTELGLSAEPTVVEQLAVGGESPVTSSSSESKLELSFVARTDVQSDLSHNYIVTRDERALSWDELYSVLGEPDELAYVNRSDTMHALSAWGGGLLLGASASWNLLTTHFYEAPTSHRVAALTGIVVGSAIVAMLPWLDSSPSYAEMSDWIERYNESLEVTSSASAQ